MPQDLKERYLTRFDELIDRGEQILGNLLQARGTSRSSQEGRSLGKMNTDALITLHAWLRNCVALLSNVFPREETYGVWIKEFGRAYRRIDLLKRKVEELRAHREDFQKGMYADLEAHMEAEFAADYMTQAEQLLGAGVSGQFDHVPAAVLSGAVLERALRTLCQQQTPATGRWTLNGLKVGDTTPTKISFQRITDLPSIDD